LPTVEYRKKRDQILVLINGEVAEQGTHQELVEKQGDYYQLIRNQLEWAFRSALREVI